MSVIIYGPQGCGKTTNAEKLAKHLGLSNILDEFGPGQELPEDTLALTHVPGMEGALNYDDVMLAMQSEASA
ncbi:AAA family ATPase [Nitrosomonas communis]|uniref:ATPase family associated with various cellular activities (AAA) n=1 Tax=Nitrosomonas communis TaxID=44574 RepID=A0A1I4RVZ8_9PROT|nr:AAA family ATPase [Nitrosomonas communis]SFM56371.1 ATPase family associated with various cellular activities (AAA) [Nitrosomonas communis]